ncbi:phosphonate ABC transporter, permease protein PhnE [soil metagenome]
MAATPATQSLSVAELKAKLTNPRPQLGFKFFAILFLLVVAYVWGIRGTHASPREFWDGLPYVWRFIKRTMPPQWVTESWTFNLGSVDFFTINMPEIVFAIVETIQMAIIGTTLAIFLSLPFGIIASRNIAPNRVIYQVARFILNVNRAVPEIIIALIFVSAVGLGPFSGVLALAVGSIGFMGKLYAEAIESIDPAQFNAVSATGANRVQTFLYGVVPQSLPLVAAYSLLLFETNVRSATILGIVGAGGVGFELQKYMALFKYQELMGALVLIIIVVTVIDRASDAVRRRII